MAYSDFTLQRLKKDFNLQIDEQRDLFAAVEPIAGSELLNKTLQETVQLAIAINTAKARSEMIITPVLLEVRRQANGQASLFSGTEFNVDEAKGLIGYCDYILSRSREQLTINVPVILITEAKNENIKAGLGQCIAGMVPPNYLISVRDRRSPRFMEPSPQAKSGNSSNSSTPPFLLT